MIKYYYKLQTFFNLVLVIEINLIFKDMHLIKIFSGGGHSSYLKLIPAFKIRGTKRKYKQDLLGTVSFVPHNLKGVNLSCFEVSQDNGSFIYFFKYDDAHLSGSQELPVYASSTVSAYSFGDLSLRLTR